MGLKLISGSFQWTDGSDVDSFTSWDGGYPKSGDKDCGVIKFAGGSASWKNFKCSDKKSYICQIDGQVTAGQTVTTEAPSAIGDAKRDYSSKYYICLCDRPSVH